MSLYHFHGREIFLMRCPLCGSTLQGIPRFCPDCGARLSQWDLLFQRMRRSFLVVCGLFVIGLAAFAFTSPATFSRWIGEASRATQGMKTLPHPPEEALSNFCGAIHSKQYQHAYSYYSQQLQQDISLEEFINLWSANGRRFYVISCELGTPQTQGNRAEITVTFSEFYKGWRVTSDVTLIQENGDEWKIDSIESFPTDPPEVVVDTFCSGITFNNYAQAYTTYSPTLQQQVSLAQFQNAWSGNGASYYHIDTCSHSTVSIEGNQATTMLTIHEFYSNQQTTYQVTLIQDGTSWHIDNMK